MLFTIDPTLKLISEDEAKEIVRLLLQAGADRSLALQRPEGFLGLRRHLLAPETYPFRVPYSESSL